MPAKPTYGNYRVALAFHIGKRSYGHVKLDDLSLVVVVDTPGPIEGNWSV